MLANGGYQYEPYVVKQITGPDGEVNFQAEPHLITKVNLDSEALSVIRRGMHEVMLPGRRGVGQWISILSVYCGPVMRDNQKVEVAGKTGTAEIGPQTPHSWFISYAPFEDPEIAVAVFVHMGVLVQPAPFQWLILSTKPISRLPQGNGSDSINLSELLTAFCPSLSQDASWGTRCVCS